MSQENVEIVEHFFRVWGAGDIEDAYELFDPNVVMRMEGDWPEPGPYLGREAVMRWDAQFRETWDSVWVETLRDHRHAGDRVVARYALHGEGKGPASRLEVTIVHTIRRGMIREVEFFWDHAEALEAVGLSE
ncbi:MAG: SnoaL-like domain [Thermoleophilaceae bacterium]|jgi:ketosteroid isomerase-like protein|nr:SnoaL-like domain [Thermoleophilaceae bacterium]